MTVRVYITFKWRSREVIYANVTICRSKVNNCVVCFPPGHIAKAVNLTVALLLKWNIMSTCVLKLIYSTHAQGFGHVKRNSCSIFFSPCSFHWVCGAKWVGTVLFWRWAGSFINGLPSEVLHCCTVLGVVEKGKRCYVISQRIVRRDESLSPSGFEETAHNGSSRVRAWPTFPYQPWKSVSLTQCKDMKLQEKYTYV